MAEERRLVTVLFADVVDSTAMGESLDPEDVRALLARLFAIASDAIERHGGRLEKFIGDAIMAVFGLPAAHEDDADRALSAALELRDRVRADAALADRVPIRLGVMGGEVIATREADAREFIVTGDPVNTAARLQQTAEPWSIVVGERTVRAASAAFQFGPVIAVAAKGKAAPIEARELRGRSSKPRDRPPTRLVGRAADLDQLRLVGRRAFDERRPFLVSIVAPAGVGKSRVLEEFLGGLGPDTRVALAQCLPYGQRLTYWPMRTILLSIVDLDEGSSAEDVRTALAAWLGDAGEPGAERMAELLAATVGASEVEGDRLAVFAAWRRLVEVAAERAPLVLVIEDLHWSSDSLLDLVEAMLQPRADVPLLMIALARPELLDRRPGWGGGRRNAISLSLEPLPSSAVAELVSDLLDTPSPAIVSAVVERAEGNPFYAGEIVRSLVDRLGPAPDAQAVERAIAALPDTVHGTVLARLDALDPNPRRVVQLGAVIGRTFEPRVVTALDPSLPNDAVDAAVDDLLDRDFVRPSGLTGLTFRHILIREVAYGTLPRAERARLHGAAGRWLAGEATATGRVEELAELVAFHLREAVTLASILGEQTEDLVGDAVLWLRRAADGAAAGAAAAEAARHLNAAIELAPAEDQPDLLERLGSVWNGGDQAVDAFARAYRLGRELGLDDDQALRTLAQEMIVRSRWVGSVGQRLEAGERDRRYDTVLELLERPVSERTRLFGILAMAFRPMIYDIATPEQLQDGAMWAQRAEDAATALGDVEAISISLDAALFMGLATDRMAEVLAITARRQALADRVSTEERADTWIVRAWAETISGRLASAEAAAERARAGLVTGQASAWVLGATAWRVTALGMLGRWDEALVDAARAETTWIESELLAPGYALNGFASALLISRARCDTVGADRWKADILRGSERLPGMNRVRPAVALANADLDALAAAVATFDEMSPRLDGIALALAALADRRHAVDLDRLDTLVAYAGERELGLVSSQALRLRGILRRDESDLRAALDAFVAMGALPFIARTRTELGLLVGDIALVERGLDDLEALGDAAQSARVAGERAATAAQA